MPKQETFAASQSHSRNKIALDETFVVPPVSMEPMKMEVSVERASTKRSTKRAKKVSYCTKNSESYVIFMFLKLCFQN
jgi:hypothetical protein